VVGLASISSSRFVMAVSFALSGWTLRLSVSRA
jgi:hypothetical protein